MPTPERPAKADKRRLRIGKYEVIRHIASGGMGAVYRAVDTDLNREVALKVLAPQLAAKPAMLERFRREARSAARLRHENIIAIYDVGEASGTYFLALEFVDGTDLHEFISRRGRLAPELARDVLTQAARALDHAHQQGIVHRDVKPSNFLIAEKDGTVRVKLADLGLARETSDDEFRVTRAGTTVGTVDYMSPEQARDSRAADIRSDIYSLGCTFYHMLAGHCPFPEGSLTERIYKHVEAEPPDVRRLNRDAPAGLVAVLRRMLRKKPEDRFQTPAELLDALADPEQFAASWQPPASMAAIPVAPARPAVPTPSPKTPSTVEQAVPKTVATAAAAKLAKKRLRDEDDEDDEAPRPKRAKKRGAPKWWPLAAGAAAAVLVGVAVLVLATGGTPSGDGATAADGSKGDDRKRDRPPLKILPDDKKPPEPEIRPVAAGAVDIAAAQAEYEGPLAKLAPPKIDGPTVRVRRRGTGDDCATLTEALAKAPDGRTTLLEIHDNGPLFEPSLPRVSGKSVVLRAAPGFRPLITWVPAPGPAPALLSLEKGRLTLEGLDVVVKWTDEGAGGPATFVRVLGGELDCRDCTFSVAGRHAGGVRVFDLEGTPLARARGRVSRCYVRGADVCPLTLSGPVDEVLLDRCLFVCERPVVTASVPHEPPCTLRVVRSTLIGGKALLRLAQAGQKEGAPGFKVLAWDSLMARAGDEPEGELIQISDRGRAERLSWKALNCLYVGWEKLLSFADGAIAAADEEAWGARWGTVGTDRALTQPWPKGLPAGIEEAAPRQFDPSGSAACFAATGGPGLLGCDLTAVAAGRANWLSMTHDRIALLPLTLPDEPAPAVPPGGGGRYHGETVKLTPQTDLGALLRSRLQSMVPGPKVVLHLIGEGEYTTSPLVVKGTELVVTVAPPEGKAKPLTLSPNPGTAGEKEALIQVEGGSLEAHGLRIAFANSPLAPAPLRAIKVRGGALRLFDCRLDGPLDKPSPAYRELIAFDGSGSERAEQARACALHRCVFVSGKCVLRVAGAGVRLRMNQCAAVAVDDLIHFDPTGAKGRLNVHVSLENNTLAARGAAFRVGDAPRATPADHIVIQADGNLFLDPFPLPFATAPRPSSLLRHEGASLARGLLLWQGKGNAYDKRLGGYLSAADAKSAGTHADWARHWGKAFELQPLFVEWPAFPVATFPADRPQLDRLRLPTTVRAVVGADLARLGLLKKK